MSEMTEFEQVLAATYGERSRTQWMRRIFDLFPEHEYECNFMCGNSTPKMFRWTPPRESVDYVIYPEYPSGIAPTPEQQNKS